MHTHVIEKGENINMSAHRESQIERDEEEEMVRTVGGRGRSLIQAVIRLRRGRTGRAPQNLDQTPNFAVQALQESGSTWWSGGKTRRVSGKGDKK